MLVRYLLTNLAFSIGLTLLLNWAILWYNRDLFILGNVWLINGQGDGDDHPHVETCDIVIGVLSARNNFNQRHAIRRTWWPTTAAANTDTYCRVKAWFIVGREPCAVHPLDRMDVHDCAPWRVNLEESDPELSGRLHLLSIVRGSTVDQPLTTTKLESGLMFKVLHAVVISKMGLIEAANCFNSSRTATLLDAATQEVVTKVQVVESSDNISRSAGGYVYRSIEPILLPSGFVGILYTEDECEDGTQDLPSQYGYDLAGGLLQLTHVTSVDGELNTFDEQRTVVAVSFGYTVHDVEELTSHVASRTQRQTEWNLKLETEAEQLQEEASANSDIVFVDMIDVYRNLPLKLLAFYDWVRTHYNFSYAIKMDDDTVLNLREMMTSLPPAPFLSSSTWWGHFRQNWAVERHGKWTETTYRSVTYPPFACGAAYVISADLVNWLADNRRFLHPFQGEDVSMGIWLAPLNPVTVHDTRWSCSDECSGRDRSQLFSLGQLTLSGMKIAWSSLNECRNICGCD